MAGTHNQRPVVSVAHVVPHTGRMQKRVPAIVVFSGFVSLIAFMLYAADFATTNRKVSTLIECQLKAQTVNQRAEQYYWHDERVRRGDSLSTLVARLPLGSVAKAIVLSHLTDSRTPLVLAPGASVTTAVDDDGVLQLSQWRSSERMVTLKHEENTAYSKQEAAIPLDKRVVYATGVFRNSVFASLTHARIPDVIAWKVIEMFATEINLYSGLRNGDPFSVVYEESRYRGEVVSIGRILAAEFVVKDKSHGMVWFEYRPGVIGSGGAHFTFDGRDNRKGFLQSPLEVSVVSSEFSDERYHPILQTWQAHKGVDFAAPVGSKIMATADGIVDFAGEQPGYGNVVILKHENKYSTLDAHMARFSEGIDKGARVKRGEVIGEVGMTGLTTGPHLHFEFRIDDVHHDPQSVDMPKARPLAPEVRQAIQAAAKPFQQTFTVRRAQGPWLFE